MTASGVSSTIRSIPVAISRARMFRPSRPMMRPFISSLGRSTTDTVVSMVCSTAQRWMDVDRILRARLLARFRASSSICFTSAVASRRASSWSTSTSCCLASSRVMPATFSNCSCCSRRSSFTFVSSSLIRTSREMSPFSRLAWSFSFLLSCSSRRASAWSRWVSFCSVATSSFRFSLTSASCSLRSLNSSSFPSRTFSRLICSASRRARVTISSACACAARSRSATTRFFMRK